MLEVHTIPCGIVDILIWYLWFLVGFLAFALYRIGCIYPGISLKNTLARAADSTNPGLDSPVCAVSSPYTLVDILVFLFCGAGELGFCPFLFLFSTNDDPIGILATSSMIVIGLIGEYRSLEISTLFWLLCMPHQLPYETQQSLSFYGIKNLLNPLKFTWQLALQLCNAATQLNYAQWYYLLTASSSPFIAPNQIILIITKSTRSSWPNHALTTQIHHRFYQLNGWIRHHYASLPQVSLINCF